jgi:Gpi18-like mannosyltransferase
MSSPAATEAKPEAVTPVAATTGKAAPRWRKMLSGDFAKALALVVAWQIVLTTVAVIFGPTLAHYEGIPKDGVGSTFSLLSHTYRWDASSYGEILDGAYNTRITAGAFYPLFPICVWIAQTITFGQIGLLVAGLIVNTIATWLAVVALLKISRYFFAAKQAPWLVVAAFLTAPTAFFLHAFYSEAVFCALGFWAYLFALRRQWAWNGLCLIPITASRVTAALFVGLCFVEFWRSKEWRLRGVLSWPVLWFPAAFGSPRLWGT